MSNITKSSLPLELLDTVFTNLHPSDSDWHLGWPDSQKVREPLSACTLVSRSWNHLAREHLFQDVVYSFQRPPAEGLSIDAEANSDSPRRWGACPTGKGKRVVRLPHKTLQMFHDFLEQSPSLRLSIRRLRLACYPTIDNDSWPSVWGYDLQEADNIEPTTLASLIRSLPRLKQFIPWNIFLTSTTHHDTSSPASCVSVPEIQIRYGVGHPTSLETCRLLTCLGRVDELVIGRPSYGYIGIKRDKDCLPETFPSSVFLDVRSLTVRDVWNDPPLHCISQLLCRSPSIQRLCKLVLDSVSFETVPGIEVMLRDFGHRLQYFKLTFVDSGRTGYYNETFDLSVISGLRELAIGISPELSDAQTRDGLMMDGLAYFRTTVLSPKTNPQLQKITFCFGSSDRVAIYEDDDGDVVIETAEVDEDEWWNGQELRRCISNFEEHFAGLVHAFQLKGLVLDCRDDIFPRPVQFTYFSKMLRRIAPLVFQRLSHEGLLILDDDSITAA